MFKLFLLLIGFSFTLFSYAYDGTQQPVLKKQIPIDTTKNDSPLEISNAAQESTSTFTNLFEKKAGDDATYGLNPKAEKFVDDFIQKNSNELTEMKHWAQPLFDKMDEILKMYSIPTEMKYLAVIESKLKNTACSYAGAVGPWQFMPATARGFGLTVNGKQDERRDLIKSTYAACRYMNQLFDTYGDWLLVIAAYNCGAGNVDKAIRKSGSKDFWNLQHFLPSESRGHVKKFIATHFIMEGGGSICTVTKNEAENLPLLSSKIDSTILDGTISQQISGRYLSSIIVKHIDMETNLFNKLNPAFDDKIGSLGKYSLRLPEEKMYAFLSKKNDIIIESVQEIMKVGFNSN